MRLSTPSNYEVSGGRQRMTLRAACAEMWPRRSPGHQHDQRSEETLSDGENDERGKAVGEPAQKRAYREAADGAEHDAAPAEPARQPTGRRVAMAVATRLSVTTQAISSRSQKARIGFVARRHWPG